MTGAEIIAAWDKWLATNAVQGMLAGRPDRYNFEAALLQTFMAGIEAAEAIWRNVPGGKVETL